MAPHLVLESKQREVISVNDVTDITAHAGEHHWKRYACHQAALCKFIGKVFLPSTCRMAHAIRPSSKPTAMPKRTTRHLPIGVLLQSDETVQVCFLHVYKHELGSLEYPFPPHPRMGCRDAQQNFLCFQRRHCGKQVSPCRLALRLKVAGDQAATNHLILKRSLVHIHPLCVHWRPPSFRVALSTTRVAEHAYQAWIEDPTSPRVQRVALRLVRRSDVYLALNMWTCTSSQKNCYGACA